MASGVPNSSSETPSTDVTRPRVELRGAADGIEVHGARLLQRRSVFAPMPPFPITARTP